MKSLFLPLSICALMNFMPISINDACAYKLPIPFLSHPIPKDKNCANIDEPCVDLWVDDGILKICSNVDLEDAEIYIESSDGDELYSDTMSLDADMINYIDYDFDESTSCVIYIIVDNISYFAQFCF